MSKKSLNIDDFFVDNDNEGIYAKNHKSLNERKTENENQRDLKWRPEVGIELRKLYQAHDIISWTEAVSSNESFIDDVSIVCEKIRFVHL